MEQKGNKTMASLNAQNKDSKSLVQKGRAKKMRQGKSEQKVKGMRKL